MFDEWYAQSSFVETAPSLTPQKPAKTVQPTTDGVETDTPGKRRQIRKATVPVFEKPEIIRPKSTADLRLLRNNTMQERGDLGWSPQRRELRVEQDLEGDVTVKGLQDDGDFEMWTDSIHTALENASLEKYMFHASESRPFLTARSYRTVLQAKLHSCDMILQQISTLLSTLNNLKLGFNAVANQTSAFQSQCNTLVGEEQRLSGYADKLAENLQPFESLEPITRQLNAPGADIVTKPDFIESLKRLDQGLAFFKQNSDFKDAELYGMRYRQCMTRALTLVRVYVVNSLTTLANDINQRISAKSMNETTQSALLYAKFRSNASSVKNVVKEIEQRSHDHEEYASLLNECYQAYCGLRLRFTTPLIMTRMAEISGNKDICRSAFSFLRSVCVDEYDLFFQFFPSGEKELYRYLSDLSEPLYDHVRPRIIHEIQIIALSELCLLFQTQFMRDPDEAETSYFDSNIAQLDFGILVQSALQDAQSRLVFRTENLIVADIQNFVPKDRDLEYPRLLHVTVGSMDMMSPTSQVAGVKVHGGTMEFFDSGVLFKGWYPTLRKSIWILSKIYRLVNSAVFDDIAHQVVHLCIHSLFTAATLLATKASRLDADLFLIKHLLILKEQIGAFDIEYVRPETEIDFSRVVDRFRKISTGAIFSPDVMHEVAKLPVVVQNMLDAKEELDGKLRVAINSFTATTAKGIVDVVAGKAGMDEKEEEIKGVAEKFREEAEKTLPVVQQKTEEYIGDLRTTDILVNAVMENALTGYEKFYNEVELNHGKLAGEIWDVHTLATWLNGLVIPKNIAGDGEDEDDVASNRDSEGRLEMDFESP